MSSVPTPSSPYYRSCRVKFRDVDAGIDLHIDVNYQVNPDSLDVHSIAIQGVSRVRIFDKWDDVTSTMEGVVNLKYPWMISGLERECYTRLVKSRYFRDDEFAVWLDSEVLRHESNA